VGGGWGEEIVLVREQQFPRNGVNLFCAKKKDLESGGEGGSAGLNHIKPPHEGDRRLNLNQPRQGTSTEFGGIRQTSNKSWVGQQKRQRMM